MAELQPNGIANNRHDNADPMHAKIANGLESQQELQTRDLAENVQASRKFLEEFMPRPEARSAVTPDQVVFDPNAPISHFLPVCEGLYRSGRPNGTEGLKEAVEKVWDKDQFSEDDAKRTTIINLRGDQGKFFKPVESEVLAEAQLSRQLGIENTHFGMDEHQNVQPAYINSIIEYIDQQEADGKRVLIHCFHGTDRTGLVAAAYLATHDPQLEQLVISDPAAAFTKAMSDDGSNPVKFPELAQSLKEFIDWKHTQLVADPSLRNH